MSERPAGNYHVKHRIDQGEWNIAKWATNGKVWKWLFCCAWYEESFFPVIGPRIPPPGETSETIALIQDLHRELVWANARAHDGGFCHSGVPSACELEPCEGANTVARRAERFLKDNPVQPPADSPAQTPPGETVKEKE